MYKVKNVREHVKYADTGNADGNMRKRQSFMEILYPRKMQYAADQKIQHGYYADCRHQHAVFLPYITLIEHEKGQDYQHKAHTG